MCILRICQVIHHITLVKDIGIITSKTTIEIKIFLIKILIPKQREVRYERVIMYVNAQFHGAVVRVMLCSLLRVCGESGGGAGGGSPSRPALSPSIAPVT